MQCLRDHRPTSCENSAQQGVRRLQRSYHGTLLCWVKCWLGLEESVELAGDIADQAAFDLTVGLALGPAPLGIGTGRWVGAQPGQGHGTLSLPIHLRGRS